MNLRRIKAVVSAIALATTLMAQPNYSNTRQQETLDRGIVAFNTANNTTFISWRYFSEESGYKYQLFRNGEKMVETQRTSHTLPIESIGLPATHRDSYNIAAHQVPRGSSRCLFRAVVGEGVCGNSYSAVICKGEGSLLLA